MKAEKVCKCSHGPNDHFTYDWLPNPYPQAKLERVFEGCAATIYLGGDLGEKCKCLRFEEKETEEG